MEILRSTESDAGVRNCTCSMMPFDSVIGYVFFPDPY